MLCPLLRDPLNGIVQYANGRTIGEEVYYHCDEGYELSGTDKRICASNRNWIPQEPYCLRGGMLLF